MSEKVFCKDCKHLRFEEGESICPSYSGCKAIKKEWNSSLSHFVMNGNAEIINANNDCKKWEKKIFPTAKELILGTLSWAAIGGIIYIIILLATKG